MRIAADENVDAPLVRWLRDTGHDVDWVAESNPGDADVTILQRAHVEHRVVLTADRDFGRLVFRENLSAHGIVFLRLHTRFPEELLAALQDAWPIIEKYAKSNFLVVTSRGLRIRPLPESRK